jgi:hypothetical protein
VETLEVEEDMVGEEDIIIMEIIEEDIKTRLLIREDFKDREDIIMEEIRGLAGMLNSNSNLSRDISRGDFKEDLMGETSRGVALIEEAPFLFKETMKEAEILRVLQITEE